MELYKTGCLNITCTWWKLKSLSKKYVQGVTKTFSRGYYIIFDTSNNENEVVVLQINHQSKGTWDKLWKCDIFLGLNR